MVMVMVIAPTTSQEDIVDQSIDLLKVRLLLVVVMVTAIGMVIL